jgi:hypothetical protein
MMKTPRCVKETEVRLTIEEASAAHRKATVPSLMSPVNDESTERKTSTQMKKRVIALAI